MVRTGLQREKKNCYVTIKCDSECFSYITTSWTCVSYFHNTNYYISRSQWPGGLRRRSVAACLLRLWV